MSAALEVNGLTVTVHERVLLRGASLRATGMTAVVGPNGAGKSTLLKAIVGLLPVSGGSARFAGAELLTMPRRDRSRIVAFVEQSATTEERISVRDVVALGRIPFQSIWQTGLSVEDNDQIDAALDAVGLRSLADRAFITLSGGEQQRILLARALAQQPQLLVLDEPTSHLDINAQMLVLELLRRKADAGLTVLLALHDLNLASTYCDVVVAISDGSVVMQGTPAAVLTPALLDQVFDVSATLLRHPGSGRPVIVYEPRNSN